MARHPRFVWPGVPHHVTQRGNRRGQVFFSEEDFRTYLAWLHQDISRYGVDLLAYCLMSNHVHLVAVPAARDSLARLFQHLHMRYARRLNWSRDWTGHVWQGRFFSAPLDEPYFWRAIRYVERNPVEAGLVARAQDYPWSSARAHCESSQDPLLSQVATWTRMFESVGNWASWLGQADDPTEIDAIRTSTLRGMPCGSRQFVESLETRSGHSFSRRPRGRPRSKQ
jgi:putative transposase